MTATAPAAFIPDSQIGSVLPCPARIGTRAISGTEDRSWNSSTEKLSRPDVRGSSLRSASMGRAMAVDDRASPNPRMVAPDQGAPAQCAATVNRAPVIAICAPPRPNTERRMAQTRETLSSSPMMNSNIRTPSSLMSLMVETSVTSLSPDGPIRTPARR